VNALYALFSDPDSAQAAFDALRAAGARERDIVVISSEPFEHYGFSRRDKDSWIFWIAGAGGTVGALFAYWLTSATERAWPLTTGGMPIVAPWANLIVIFELTMLSAILATVVTLIVAARLGRRRPALYDDQVSEGRVLVGLETTAGIAVERAQQVLTTLGGELKTVP
jgi:hypothetical protein